MKCALKLRWVVVLIVGVFAVLLLPFFGVAQTKTIVRAVYKGGLELQEEPAGTILADSSVCLPKDNRYDYRGQLAKTVEKANTRMDALILDQKIAGYTDSVALLDRNIALISGTVASLKQLDGITGYLLSVGALKEILYRGAKFEGKCYKAPGGEFGHPDALGELNVRLESTDMYAESTRDIDRALQRDLPSMLKEFSALEKSVVTDKKGKKAKEKRFAELTEAVTKKVDDFMAIEPTVAATLMPREFGGRGTKLSSTPQISLVATAEECAYSALLGTVQIPSKVYNITVNAVSFSHTFQKCMPEQEALEMLVDQYNKKKVLLEKERAKFVKLLSDAGKALAALEKNKPQYFGD